MHPQVSPPKLSLRMSILISEVSLIEGGDTRLRAWEQTHVGAAQWVGAELERLGVMALSDPSQARVCYNCVCYNCVGQRYVS